MLESAGDGGGARESCTASCGVPRGRLNTCRLLSSPYDREAASMVSPAISMRFLLT